MHFNAALVYSINIRKIVFFCLKILIIILNFGGNNIPKRQASSLKVENGMPWCQPDYMLGKPVNSMISIFGYNQTLYCIANFKIWSGAKNRYLESNCLIKVMRDFNNHNFFNNHFYIVHYFIFLSTSQQSLTENDFKRSQ